ncbi:MAG TPA: hypothetical protein VGA67_00820 [Candidatus Dojkabacteria bacterium]|jgi:hypothetical protein
MDKEIKNLKREIELIKKRNALVEVNKKWETSWIRRICVAALTYFVVVSFFIVADLPNPFINSIVPTTGYILSTLSLGFFRNFFNKNS